MQLLTNCLIQNTPLISDVISIIIHYLDSVITTYIDSDTHPAYKYLNDNYYIRRHLLYRNLKPICSADTFVITSINYLVVIIYIYDTSVYFIDIDSTLINSIKLYTKFISINVDGNYLILTSKLNIYIYTISDNYTLTLQSLINTADNVLIAKDKHILLKFRREITSIDHNGVLTPIGFLHASGTFEWHGITITIDVNKLTAIYKK